VLFDDLTVYEHLEFFGKLKGIRLKDLHKAVMTAIDEVQLKPKINTLSSALSGGQKRRLSLAIALIGDSKIVFLDEPTSVGLAAYICGICSCILILGWCLCICSVSSVVCFFFLVCLFGRVWILSLAVQFGIC